MRPRVERIAPDSESSFVHRIRRDRRFEFAWHAYPEIELTLITHGQGRRFIGDSIEEFSAGDLVLIGSGLPHTYQAAPTRTPKRALMIHAATFVQFIPDFLGNDFLTRPESTHIRKLFQRGLRGLHFVGATRAAVAQRLVAMRGKRRWESLMDLLWILDRLATCDAARPISQRGFGTRLSESDARRIDVVCRYLADRYRDEIRLEEVARIAHLSVPAFGRFFKRATHKTLTRYVNELRVGHACRELVTGERPIAEIAQRAGFRNLSNFNRRFREIRRTSPRQYRAASRHPATRKDPG